MRVRSLLQNRLSRTLLNPIHIPYRILISRWPREAKRGVRIRICFGGRSKWTSRSAGRWQKQMRRLPPRRTLLFNVEFAGASPMLIKRHSRACLTSPDGAADPPKQKYVKKFSPFAGQPVNTDFNCELPLDHARNAQSREAANSTLIS